MADTNEADKKTETALPPVRTRPRRSKARLFLLWGVLLVAVAVGAYALWRYFGTYESTDDAQIDGHVDAISATKPQRVAVVWI